MKERQRDIPSSATQRISTLKRYQPHNNSAAISEEEYITILAKNRLMEDELRTEKFKLQAVEGKAMDNIAYIEELEHVIHNLRTQLDLANQQIKRQISRDEIIHQYQANMREIGLEIATLNQILEKKNKECLTLLQANTQLKNEHINYEQKLRSMTTLRKKQCDAINKILKVLEIERGPAFNDNMEEVILQIQQWILEMREKMQKVKGSVDGRNKEYSESLLKSRQQIISLEYALRLAEERNADLQKKKFMENSFSIDKKIEDVIEEMLKKEDELSSQIVQLQNQNEDLRIQIEQNSRDRNQYDNLKSKQTSDELKRLKSQISMLKREKERVEEKMQQFTNQSELEVSRYRSGEHQLSKKYRECEEENKRLRLMVIELQSDKQMLEKEISVRMNESG